MKNTISVPLKDIEAINSLCMALLEQSKLPVRSGGGRPFGTTKRKPHHNAEPGRRDKIRDAAESLNPHLDTNWTSKGLPRVPPIQRITGYSDVACWEVRKACPGYDREQAALRFKDQEFLSFVKGQWHFYMVKNQRTFRRNLKTASIVAAQEQRNHFLMHGNWEYQRAIAGTDMVSTKSLNSQDSDLGWHFAGPGAGWLRN